MNPDDILVIDEDDGVIHAAYHESKTMKDGTHVNIYKHKQYYHSLDDALRDLYGVKDDKASSS